MRDEIEHQQQLLSIHRRRMAILAPRGDAAALFEREEDAARIAEIKRVLRAAGVAVADEPGDMVIAPPPEAADIARLRKVEEAARAVATEIARHERPLMDLPPLFRRSLIALRDVLEGLR